MTTCWKNAELVKARYAIKMAFGGERKLVKKGGEKKAKLKYRADETNAGRNSKMPGREGEKIGADSSIL